MNLDPLRECIWYVEARPWMEKGPAPETPVRGSAVSVELLLPETEKEPAGPRKFLLTCAHVVRREAKPEEETPEEKQPPRERWGKALGEILCYQHGKSYSPTHAGRRSGEHFHGYLADVQKYSPYGANEVPAGKRVAFNDWALLDVRDEVFQKLPAVPLWGALQAGDTLCALGFPGGPGLLEAVRLNGLACMPSGGFQQTRKPPPGMLLLDGPDETRAGMSGCGYFSEQTGAFIGLHRASADTLKAVLAIPSMEIAQHLQSLGVGLASHNPASAPGPASQPMPALGSASQQVPAPGPKGRAIVQLALLILAACLIALFQPRTVPIKATALQYTGIPTHYPPIQNAKVILQNDSRTETLQTETNETGEFQFDLPAQAIGETWKISFPGQKTELSQLWEKDRSSYIFYVRPKGGRDN